MAMGPGAYDKLCTLVRERAQAFGAIVLVFGGNKGDGFSAQLPGELLLLVPTILREMADEIEKSGGVHRA